MTFETRLLRHAALLAACFSSAAVVPPAQAQRGVGTPLTRWLVLGPLTARNAAFASASDTTMLASSRLSTDNGWPSAGHTLRWLENSPATWTVREAPSGSLPLSAPTANSTSTTPKLGRSATT